MGVPEEVNRVGSYGEKGRFLRRGKFLPAEEEKKIE